MTELGVGKLLVKALELPEANPEELKLLKGSKAAYNRNKNKIKQNKRLNTSKDERKPTADDLLLNAANASSLLNKLLASAGDTDWLLKGSSEEEWRPFCIGDSALGASGRGGLLGLSRTEKSGSEKVYLIGSRYNSGTFWARLSSEEPRTWSNLFVASIR